MYYIYIKFCLISKIDWKLYQCGNQWFTWSEPLGEAYDKGILWASPSSNTNQSSTEALTKHTHTHKTKRYHNSLKQLWYNTYRYNGCQQLPLLLIHFHVPSLCPRSYSTFLSHSRHSFFTGHHGHETPRHQLLQRRTCRDRQHVGNILWIWRDFWNDVNELEQ